MNGSQDKDSRTDESSDTFLPRSSFALIDMMDRQERPVAPTPLDVKDTQAVADLYRRIGRRELVDELVMKRNRLKEEQDNV